jgi:hypothetical protein
MFSEYRERVLSLLRAADLSVVSLKQIREQIEQEYQLDLDEFRVEFDGFVVGLLEIIAVEKQKTEGNSLESDAVLAAALQEHYDRPTRGNRRRQPIASKSVERTSGFHAPVTLSPDLAAFVGTTEMPRVSQLTRPKSPSMSGTTYALTGCRTRVTSGLFSVTNSCATCSVKTGSTCLQ